MALRIAIAGLGSFGIRHVRTIKKLGLGEITAAISRRSSHRALPGVNFYRTAEEAFEKEEIDALVIALPPAVHGEIETLAARRSIPFFVEKPVSNDLQTAANILCEVQESGIITSVGYHSRYSPAIKKAKSILETEKPLSIHGYWLDTLPAAAWGRKKEMSGGQIVEQATHIIDIFRYLFGEPEEVYAKGRKGLRETDFESAAEMIFTFPGDRIATLSTSCEKTKGSSIGFTVGFANGAMEYAWNGKLSVRNSGGTATTGPENPSQLYEEELASFFRAVETGDRSLICSDYSDAVKTLSASLAASESLRTKKTIKIKDLD